MLNLCTLNSGSRGNAIFIGNHKISYLIDCGLSGKKTENFIRQIGYNINTLKGILITHEHSDHTSGAGILGRRLNIPVYLKKKVYDCIKDKLNDVQVKFVDNGFEENKIKFNFFSVPHDSADASGIIITYQDIKAGVITDIGFFTRLTMIKIAEVETLFLETNYDDDMLKNGSRPWSLKQRVKSRHGHLSNRAAAELFDKMNFKNLKNIVLCHISDDHNSYEKAYTTIKEKFAERNIDAVIHIGYKDKPASLIKLGE